MAYTDTFTNTNGTYLESHNANWVSVTGGNDYDIQGNGTRCVNSQSAYYYNQTFASAHYSKATRGTGVEGGPYVRVQSGAHSAYYCLYGAGDAKVYNGEVVSGSYSDWDSGVSGHSSGNVVELSIDSSTTTTVYYKVNGSTVATYTSKSALTGGRPGIGSYNGESAASCWDNWEGGDVGVGAVHYVTFNGVSVSQAQDLFEFTPNREIELLWCTVSIDSDEANQQLKCSVQRRTGAFTSGSGGSTATPQKRGTGDPAAAFTAEINNTTRASGGTQEVLSMGGWPSQGGWAYAPLPDGRASAKAGELLIVGLEVAPGSAIALSGTAVVRELP